MQRQAIESSVHDTAAREEGASSCIRPQMGPARRGGESPRASGFCGWLCCGIKTKKKQSPAPAGRSGACCSVWNVFRIPDGGCSAAPKSLRLFPLRPDVHRAAGDATAVHRSRSSSFSTENRSDGRGAGGAGARKKCGHTDTRELIARGISNLKALEM